MTLYKREDTSIPDETKRVAQASFPKGNPYLLLRDEIGLMYQDEDFVELYEGIGRRVVAPGLLAIVTVLQYAEGLSDRQAAEAVRSRIDWKYLLGLELTDPGFDFTLLSDFRSRLLAGSAEEQLLDKLLMIFKERKLLKARGRQRSDSTHVLTVVRHLNQLERVGETLRHTLNVLAKDAPEWLQSYVPQEWYQRYQARFESYRLPKSDDKREALALTIGQDGYQLLAWVYDPETPAEIQAHAAIEVLRQIWVQNYYHHADELRWRDSDDMPPASLMIQSPRDMEARFARKRDQTWTGYKAHWTETCDEDGPHLITHVITTPGPQLDSTVTDAIHAALERKGLLPKEHLVDNGYVDAGKLVDSQDRYGVDLVGPVLPDSTWQAQAGKGFDTSGFQIDWESQQVHCPQGKVSQTWKTTQDKKGLHFRVRFATQDCRECSVRTLCTHSEKYPRQLRLQPQENYQALQQARKRQETQTFKDLYAKRAGVEGTLSQAIRVTDLRQARYIGLAKTHLQNVLSAAAINLARLEVTM
jgi:transposase